MAVPFVCVPLNLDAFVLHDKVCDTGETKIIPLQQPDYVALRFNNSLIQHDVLPEANLDQCQPASRNTRISRTYQRPLNTLNLRDPVPKIPTASEQLYIQERLGVYVSWTIPRGYRAGTSTAESTKVDGKDSSQPTFRQVPNRWVIIRVLHEADYAAPKAEDQLKAFIVESNVLRSLGDLDAQIDLETDVSPFVSFGGNTSDVLAIDNQAELFLGRTTKLEDWTETQGLPNDVGRTPLHTMMSSNPYFADYQHHNSSVFSFKDTLQMSDGSYLNEAKCDYLVCGYHFDAAATDPFRANNVGGLAGSLNDRLQQFLMGLASADAAKYGATTNPTALIMNGAITGVVYDTSVRPTVLGDDYAKNFGPTVNMEPVSVGTSPFDSIMTFLLAHQKDKDQAGKSAEDDVLGSGSSDLALRLKNLASLLYAADGDDYNERMKAEDLLSGNNFKSNAGGFKWVFDKKKTAGQSPEVPTAAEAGYLAQLNELQARQDTLQREVDGLRWSMFAQFFDYLSDSNNKVAANAKMYTDKLARIRETSTPLLSEAGSIASEITRIAGDPSNDSVKPLVAAKRINNLPFYQRADPTLMLAGLDAGWPSAYLDKQTVFTSFDVDGVNVDNRVASLMGKLPAGPTRDTVSKLFTRLLSGGQQTGGVKAWAGQPFCPIFAEWEAVYYHINFEPGKGKWDMELASSPAGTNHTTFRYVQPSRHELWTDQDVLSDTRSLSGRMPILPQPAFSLAALVKQVLDTNPSAWTDKTMTKEQFIKAIGELKFVSGTMAGVTDGLLTQVAGQHVKPNVREQGMSVDPQPLAAAVKAVTGIQMTQQDLQFIGDQSAKTPYGTMVRFPNETPQSTPYNSPFKQVTSGQLAITRLTIIDKFGQAITVPKLQPPLVHPINPPEFIHPCLADQLCPTVLLDSNGNPTNQLNTVGYKPTEDDLTATGFPLSPYAQLTPAINQPARLNASFVTKQFDASGKFTAWTDCTEWENPIFGWMVVNYADLALQFFTRDGIFYTSIKIGGPTTTIASPKWQPFEPPANQDKLVTSELQQFIDKMLDPTNGGVYMQGVWDMITRAIYDMPFTSTDYAQSANAIVGKPLALVNVGMSLELAAPPLTAQHTLPANNQMTDPAIAARTLCSYEFAVKIGDHERPYDGILGYFDLKPDASGDTDYSALYTYYPYTGTGAKPIADPRIALQTKDAAQRVTLKPFFVEPTQQGFAAAQAAQYTVKMCVVDPYAPLHLYTGALPIRALQLSGWTMGNALRNMTAFFGASVLLTADVPKKYDPAKPLAADSWLDAQQAGIPVSDQPANVKIPVAGGKGLWNWLQPYWTAAGADGSGPLGTHFNALSVQNEDGKLRTLPGPYTIADGFLQLAKPLIRDDLPAGM